MSKEIRVGPLLRDFGGVDVRVEQRKASVRLAFSASSEEPVDRFFGVEILSHEPSAIRMERFTRGAVPLLFNHNWDDPIGMVDAVSVADGRLMVDDSHLFDTDRAVEVRRMIDGGLRNVSISYQIHEVEEDRKAGSYRVVDWEPLEISIVTVPADSSIGIGRAQDNEARPVRVRSASQPAAPAALQEDKSMSEQQATAAGAQAAQFVDDVVDPAKYEAGRISTIRKLAASNDISDERQVMHWVRSGKSWDQIADDILKVREERSRASPAVLGLSPRETQRFSIVRAINAAVTKDWSKAGFEAEVSRSAAQRMGRSLSEHSFLIPMEVLTREMIVGTASSGGNLVGTDIQPQSFIDILRNRSIVMSLGARTLSGLQGHVTIPTQAASGNVGWVGESGTSTESNATFGQKTMSPKTVAGYQQYSRQLFLQSSLDVEALINADLAAQIALACDTACLTGTSTNSTQPLGIRYTSGLGTANVAGTSGAVYTDLIKFQSTVASANALFSNFAYVTHPAVAAILMGKSRFTNSDTPIWEGALLDGNMVGKRAMSSVQVTSGHIYGGDFTQVVIGEWGPAPVEIEVNPYANFQAGITGVRAMYSCDCLVRYGAAFALGTGYTS